MAKLPQAPATMVSMPSWTIPSNSSSLELFLGHKNKKNNQIHLPFTSTFLLILGLRGLDLVCSQSLPFYGLGLWSQVKIRVKVWVRVRM